MCLRVPLSTRLAALREPTSSTKEHSGVFQPRWELQRNAAVHFVKLHSTSAVRRPRTCLRAVACTSWGLGLYFNDSLARRTSNLTQPTVTLNAYTLSACWSVADPKSLPTKVLIAILWNPSHRSIEGNDQVFEATRNLNTTELDMYTHIDLQKQWAARLRSSKYWILRKNLIANFPMVAPDRTAKMQQKLTN